MVSMVVFDMAGTTVNEDNVVYKTLQKAINKKGFDFSLDQVLENGAGKEKSEAIKSILNTKTPHVDEKIAEDIFQDFVSLLTDAYKHLRVVPQPHALEVFRILRQRNIRIVLNTGYNEEIARSLIAKMEWKKAVEYDALITSSDVEKNRPDKEMIVLAMRMFSIQNPKEVIKVGDSIIDIEEGKNAGCLLSIGISTGAHNIQQLRSANPDYIINNLMELVPIIDRLNAPH